MKVVVVEPNKKPEVREIGSGLGAMQAVVGGLIEAVYPFEDPVALICNEEGKINGLPLNRCLRNVDGQIIDVIAGTFFLCGAPSESESFTSLTEEQIETYMKRYAVPEVILSICGKIVVLPCTG